MNAAAPSLANYQWCQLESIMDLMDYREAIEDSYKDFVERAKYNCTCQHFVLKLIEFIRMGPAAGLVLIIKSRKGAMLGLISGYAGTDHTGQRAFNIYSAWHNQKDQLVISAFLSWLDRWCQQHGYNYYLTETTRSSGASIRCFEQKYGFKRVAITFRRDVLAFGQEDAAPLPIEDEEPLFAEQGLVPAAAE